MFILRVKVNKDNCFEVLKKIEQDYPDVRWRTKDRLKPTEKIPQATAQATVINMHEDNTLTYNGCISSAYDADAITAAEFLGADSTDMYITNEQIQLLKIVFSPKAVRNYLKVATYIEYTRNNNDKAAYFERKLAEILNTEDKEKK